MNRIINEKRDKKNMRIDLRDYFDNDEIYVLFNQNQGVKLSNLIMHKSNFSIKSVKKFHIGRYGKPIDLRLIFDVDKDWFYISELLRTDGHISKNFDRIKLTNISHLLKEKMRTFFTKYGIKYFRDRENDRILIFNRTFALILNKIFDIPAGNKTFICAMPTWMKEADLNLLAFAIKGSFDGDGCVQLTMGHRTGGCTRRIRLYGASTKYLEDIRDCLLKFNITSEIFKDPRANKTYFLQISRKEGILQFAKQIGFLHPKRKNKLSKVVASYKNYYRLSDFEAMVTKLLKEKGPLTINKLAVAVKRRDSTVSEQITKLEQEGKIKTKRYGVKRIVFI